MGFSFFKSKNRDKKKTDTPPLPGQRRERSSNPQVSIKLAEHFLRENKRDLAVDEYLNAAQAFLDKRQSQLAMAVYRNIITIDPERYGIYETLADLYRMSGFPGDGASVLLALAYQYQKAGHNTEVKRVLDAVLEFAPDNQILKRKVEAFFKADHLSGAAAPKPAPAGRMSAAAPSLKTDAALKQAPAVSPDIFAPPSVRTPAVTPETTALKPDAPVKQAPVPASDIFAPPSVRTPEGTSAPALKPDEPVKQAPVPASDIFAPPSVHTPEGTSAPALKPDEPVKQAPVPASDIFASGRPPAPVRTAASASVLKPDEAADRPFDLKAALADDLPVPPAETAAEAGFDLRSALEADFSTPADEAEQQIMADAAAESFFDLQSALEADPSLGFDYDSSADDFPGSDDGSLFSVLNVVKDIAVQDPRQDTPLFHFNLGIAYMQCADYEQAVDELLSALYGIPDKIGCYVRLAECSLNLQRRELACGFLREALDYPDIRPEQAQAVRQRLDEISAA